MTRAITDFNSELICLLRRSLSEARSLLFRPAEENLRLVIAVSGGEDSVVLLDALVAISKVIKLDLAVGHFDHGLRKESGADCCFVADLASKYQLPFYSETGKFSVPGENVESWARKARYDFLLRTLVTVNADFIVTAHHQKDQAETLLFRVITGRLATSAYSIAPIDLERKLLRPILDVSKKEVSEYFVKHQLKCVVDQTNFDLSRTRNNIRHVLLEEIKTKYNPRIEEAAAIVAARLNDDDSALKHAALNGFEQIDGDVSRLGESLPALRWRIIRIIAARQIGENAEKLSYTDLKRIEQMVLKANFDAKLLKLGFEIGCIYRKKEGLIFGRLNDFEREAGYSDSLHIPGSVEHRYIDGGGYVIRAEMIDNVNSGLVTSCIDEARKSKESVLYLDVSAIATAELIVRSRKDGDVLKVWKRGTRSVKKLLLDKGVKQKERQRVVVVEKGGEIIWVPYVARGVIAPLTDSSNKIIKISIHTLGKGVIESTQKGN